MHIKNVITNFFRTGKAGKIKTRESIVTVAKAVNIQAKDIPQAKASTPAATVAAANAVKAQISMQKKV